MDLKAREKKKKKTDTESHQASIVPQGRLYHFIPPSNMSVCVGGKTKCVYLDFNGCNLSDGKEKPQSHFTVSLFLPLVIVVLTWQFPNFIVVVSCPQILWFQNSRIFVLNSDLLWYLCNMGYSVTHSRIASNFSFRSSLTHPTPHRHLIKSFPAMWRKIYEHSHNVCLWSHK